MELRDVVLLLILFVLSHAVYRDAFGHIYAADSLFPYPVGTGHA